MSRRFALAAACFLAAIALGSLPGCAGAGAPPKAQAPKETPPQTLGAGDVIKISFPASPTMDVTQQIRMDGRINLAVVGEVEVANKTPAQLETELVQLFAPQLVSKEVKVTVVTSAFAVYVNGAVLKPGKITPIRPMTALDAIMEAGGFDMAKADTKAVTVIRQENGQTKNFVLNLKAALSGKPSEPFYLKSFDIVWVPEKFTWF